MNNYILEACVDSLESAREAIAGGANRLELCSNLIIGGTTPSVSLYKQIRGISDIKIHALIRPRFGDFCYTDSDIQVMKEEITAFEKLGVDGIVIGVLRPDGTLNLEQMEELIGCAGNLSITLHRAFDVCADPMAAMEQAICMGIRTILTSGQESSCLQGAELLSKLAEKSEKRIDILAGGGINAQVIASLYPLTNITSYHMSGKKIIDSPMEYRKSKVNMGLSEFSEYSIWRTDAEEIAHAIEILEGL